MSYNQSGNNRAAPYPSEPNSSSQHLGKRSQKKHLYNDDDYSSRQEVEFSGRKRDQKEVHKISSSDDDTTTRGSHNMGQQQNDQNSLSNDKGDFSRYPEVQPRTIEVLKEKGIKSLFPI